MYLHELLICTYVLHRFERVVCIPCYFALASMVFEFVYVFCMAFTYCCLIVFWNGFNMMLIFGCCWYGLVFRIYVFEIWMC